MKAGNGVCAGRVLQAVSLRGAMDVVGGYLSPPRSSSLSNVICLSTYGEGRGRIRSTTSQASLVRWARKVTAVTFWVGRPTRMTLLLLEKAQSPKAR